MENGESIDNIQRETMLNTLNQGEITIDVIEITGIQSFQRHKIMAIL